MRFIKTFLVLVLPAFMLVGCVTQNISAPANGLSGSVDTSVKADVKVGGAISGTSSVQVLFGVLAFGGDSQFADGVSYGGGGTGLPSFGPVEKVKSAAAYNAIKASGADLIVAPRYTIDVNSYVVYKVVTATVTGYKGTIKSIR